MGKSQLFLFEGMPVGYFEQEEFPHTAGRYRYVPFRGPGDFEMQKQREAGTQPRCYFNTSGGQVSFAIRDCPVYGELVICDFETTPR
jgi:hypothetical protein